MSKLDLTLSMCKYVLIHCEKADFVKPCEII